MEVYELFIYFSEIKSHIKMTFPEVLLQLALEISFTDMLI